MAELRRHTCEEHPDAEPLLNRRYDAFYCSECRAWLSPKCIAPYCTRCKGRPERAPHPFDPDAGDVSPPDEPTKDL